MPDNTHFTQDDHWVIWNGSLGILDTVSIGQVESSLSGRSAWLDEPYDMVGPFSLDELEEQGLISFEACFVMSRQRWQQNQVELRRESLRLRREAQARMYEYQARYNAGRAPRNRFQHNTQEKIHREILNLPMDGPLAVSQIKAAYRRLAQKAHPDTGGDHEQFIRITQARDTLLELLSGD